MAHTTSPAQFAHRQRPPGPRGHLLWGSLPDIQRDSLGFMRQITNQYGDIVHYRVGWVHSYLLNHPDYVKHVLQDNQKNYTKEIFSFKMLRWIVGYGLLTSDGAFWLRQRRLTQPAFHRQRIAALGPLMTGATIDLQLEWDALAQRSVVLDIDDAMMRLTLRIVGEALFGTNLSSKATQVGSAFTTLSEQLIERFRLLGLLPPVLPTRRDREFRAAQYALDRVVYDIIQERRKADQDRGDLLSMLMLAHDEETGAQMNDDHLRDEVKTLMLAGHETTANALTWAWYLLSQHPEVEQQLHAELDSVLQGRAPTMNDLSKLRYTRMVVDEVLRLYPPAPLMPRLVVADDAIGGYRIPAKSAVVISIYTLHRHPAFWDNPDGFDPERFAPERETRRPRFAYFPFGGGPRQCIGNNFALAEAQLVLATLAQRYRLRLAPGFTPVPEALITLRPRGGMPMLLERR